MKKEGNVAFCDNMNGMQNASNHAQHLVTLHKWAEMIISFFILAGGP